MIHILCNNANSKIDGIGDYAFNLFKTLCVELRNEVVKLWTANSGRKSKLGQVFSLKMSLVIFRLTNKIGNHDVVILEYPFAECNPIIVFFIKRLKGKVERNRGLFVLSLHEYKRANYFRKIIVDSILPLADRIMVTDVETQMLIERKTNVQVHIREIPSNIYDGRFVDTKKKDKNIYIFFGLISKSKAFKELLDAWKMFNVKKDKTLLILSSSDFSNTYKEYGVEYYANLSPQEISTYFESAGFCILPIIPHVSIINATYKTALCYECIPIGLFDSCIINKTSHICINSNSAQDILSGLLISSNMKDEEFYNALTKLKELPKASFQNTAKEYIRVIKG